MNRKLILNLLSSSSIFVSLMSSLAAIHPAHAAPTQGLIHKNGQTCIVTPFPVQDYLSFPWRSWHASRLNGGNPRTALARLGGSLIGNLRA